MFIDLKYFNWQHHLKNQSFFFGPNENNVCRFKTSKQKWATNSMPSSWEALDIRFSLFGQINPLDQANLHIDWLSVQLVTNVLLWKKKSIICNATTYEQTICEGSNPQKSFANGLLSFRGGIPTILAHSFFFSNFDVIFVMGAFRAIASNKFFRTHKKFTHICANIFCAFRIFET